MRRGQGAVASTAAATGQLKIEEEGCQDSVGSPEPGDVPQNQSLVVQRDGPQAFRTVINDRHGVCLVEFSESCIASDLLEHGMA